MTTVHNRYHVTNDVCGLLDTAMGKSDAMQIAQHWANSENFSVDVFDSMAHTGIPDVWHIFPQKMNSGVTGKNGNAE